ncbi:MAG: Sir2 silent information regulator family NAD-dependent deacetylase [Eubacteriaceae bacterium]|nr:Sir2 silent information regulator family NAD-dependent deacetylase [Eubacteriaceae bacterium]
MFPKIWAKKSMSDRLDPIHKLQAAINEAEAVIIGAGAGLSTSAGFVYDGERFRKHFSDFEEKYGYHDMYTGGFFSYKTMEEHWAYWSRYIFVNRYMDAPKPVYMNLYELVKNKDYFVLTTNVDHCFQKTGFDRHRLFYTQGDYGLFQCSTPCCQETFENEDMVRKMLDAQKDMRISSEVLPICPHCGKAMTMNLRSDGRFVENEGWLIAAERYEKFLRRCKNHKVLFLELGTGYNTPGIIKYPFWQMTNSWKDASYACINHGQAKAPCEIEEKSIYINDDIGNVLNQLLYSAESEALCGA